MTVNRVGLVLGAGGLPGHAWHCGVLAALATETGWDARSADVIVGTSAGAGVGAYLRGGISGEDLYERLHRPGAAVHHDRLQVLSGQVAAPGTAPPDRRRWRPQAPAVVARALLPPWPRPGVVIGALLQQGAVPTTAIGSWTFELHGERWPEQPLWICAVDLTTGRRTVFGRDPVPVEVPLATAVEASSAVPGFFRPVVAGSRRYIDGGMHSPTNADLLADPDLELDVVIVSSPMSASSGAGRITGRSYHHRLLEWEASRCRALGSVVVRFEPGRELLPLMNGGRRTRPGDMTAIAEAALRSVRRHLRRHDVRSRLDELARTA